MGSASSKFKKYVQHGDEYAAMQVYQGSPELKKSFDPNLSYGENRHHNTAMHYAARHGMKHLLRTFLTDLNGDPNKRNALDETVLHSACSPGTSFPPPSAHLSISCVQLSGNGGGVVPGVGVAEAAPLSASAQERRAACVALLLQWRGARLPASEERERVHIDAADREGSTALQLAAGAGLAGAARLLLAGGARCLTRDARGHTAAARALQAGHARLAALLQRAMLFSEEPVDWCSPRWGWPVAELAEQEAEEALGGAGAGGAGSAGADTHEGLRAHELREAKDRLLVDTSDMLRVPLFTADQLLRDNEWCKDMLVERWMKDAAACCAAAGVPLPGGSLDSEHPEEGLPDSGEQQTIECGICCEEVLASEAGGGACGHAYCVACWSRYLAGRVRDGDARPACPAPRCRRPAPPALLQRCLSPDTQRKYLMFDIKAFVESSRGMKWCPVAGCGRAVRLLEPELSIPNIPTGNSDDGEDVCPGGYPPVSRAVDCGDFHFFCWECHGEAHAPLGCSPWARWSARAGSAPPAPLAAAAGGAESAASSLWLLAHCKPCPSCACPIQKNDGCNHMKCTKCKFDFCWVCLESWKRHGSATGGYFRCTRDEATARADQSRGAALAEARVQNVEAQEQWRFAVQCARFRRHELRWAAERELLATACARAKALDPAGSSGGVLEAAARELALTRRVLSGACAYTFVLPASAPHRAAFHYAQEELERCGARLAALAAREAVEAPLAVLRRGAAAARRWRLALLRLARPPAPPAALSAPELRLMARLLARGRLDPRDPWRAPLGPRAEPLRAPDPLDPDHTILQEPQLTISPHVGGENSGNPNDADVYRINVSEYNMDLIIALEMSRLQMLEEQARRAVEADTPPHSQEGTLPHNRQRPARLNISVSIGGTSDYEDKLSLSDDQLKLAIQLSLQEGAGAGGPSTTHSGGSRLTRQEETWSRAADITVGYFLKALGGAPLDLPNLALGLDLLTPHKGGGDDSGSSLADQQPGSSGLGGHSGKDRPPLLRSGGAGQRPPLLRQMGAGRLRRSWSMGDLSVRSSSTDDTNTYCRVPDEITIGMDDPFLPEGGDAPPAALLPPPKAASQPSTAERRTHFTITKNIQIDAYTQQCDFNYDIVKTPKAASPRRHPAWHPACCEPRCAGPAPPATVSVDCRGKLGPAGHLNCSHLRVNTANMAGQTQADGSRRHSDHSPRAAPTERPAERRPRCASEAGGRRRDQPAEPAGPPGPPPDKRPARRGLETDSSNECESETGIPKSPTLYISGVSICRETSPKSSAASVHQPPEPRALAASPYFPGGSKSPKVRQKLAWKDFKASGALPASPVLVHVTSPSLSPCSERAPVEPAPASPELLRAASPGILDLPVLPPSHFSDDVFLDEDDPGLTLDCGELRADTGHCSLRGTVYAGRHSGGILLSNVASLGASPLEAAVKPKKEEALYENVFPKAAATDQLGFEMSLPSSPTGVAVGAHCGLQKSWSARPLGNPQDFGDEVQAGAKLKSKSANEPERDREMFHFPKSSTDGALSSVLHVQESNLSSDDFHEALFLLERSPKTRDSKRRKRSKKRDKDKDKDKSDKDSKKEREGDRKSEEVPCSCADEGKGDKKEKEDSGQARGCIIENDSPSIDQDEASSAL